MRNSFLSKRLVVLVMCAVWMVSLIGCTVSTTGTGTSTSGTTTGTSSSNTNSGTNLGGLFNPPSTTNTPSSNNSVSGLDGNGVAGATKEDVQKNFNISMADGSGKNEGGLTIAGGTWDASEISQINTILSNLPASFRSATTTLIKSSSITDGNGVIGGLHYATNNEIYISAQSGDLPGTLVHEMTHAWQEKNTGVMESWKSQFWNGESSPKTSSVTPYGNTNPYEDMAESVRQYCLSGSAMKSADPDRYNFIKQNIMGGKEY